MRRVGAPGTRVVMAPTATRNPRRDARALRFLLLLLGGWTLARAMAYWSAALPPARPDAIPRPPWERSLPPPRWAPAAALAPARRAAPASAPAPAARFAQRPRGEPPVAAKVPAGGGWQDINRHDLRFALIARLLPPRPGATSRAAFPAGSSAWMTAPLSTRSGPPGTGRPFWMQRDLSGWSLSGWVYVRSGSGRPSEGIAAAGQLGGSQGGARLAYGFGDGGRLRGYARATVALAAPRQREAALGFAFAPVARWPVDVAVEQRVAAGRGGRTALAAMVGGGVGDVALPHRFRLEAYGQAGLVGARRRDGFVDAALTIDREVARLPEATLHLGALAAAAAQPGAARLDIGPRLTLRLPEIGGGSRVALDWRQRVAGDAKPESGLALTLAADF